MAEEAKITSFPVPGSDSQRSFVSKNDEENKKLEAVGYCLPNTSVYTQEEMVPVVRLIWLQKVDTI